MSTLGENYKEIADVEKALDAGRNCNLANIKYITSETIVSASMFGSTNTTYVVSSNVRFNGDLNVGENSTLIFNGGTIKANTITLNKTYIIGVNCFDDTKVLGSVSNEKILSSWFVNGADFSKNFISLMRLARLNDKGVVFSKNTYHLTGSKFSEKSVSTMSDEVISTSVDFANSTIVLHADTDDFPLYVSNSVPEDITNTRNDWNEYIRGKNISDTSLYDSVLFVESAKTEGNIEFMRPVSGSVTPYYKQEVLRIDQNGYITNQVFSTSLDVLKVTKISCKKSLIIENLNIDVIDEYGGKSSGYRYLGLYITNFSNVSIRNVKYSSDVVSDSTGTPYQTQQLYVNLGFNLTVDNYQSSRTYEDENTGYETEHSSYNLALNRIVNCQLRNVYASGLRSNAWGSIGSNYVYDWLVERCRFSRIDSHCRVYNLIVRDTTIGRYGISYGGSGTIEIDNCDYYGSRFMRARNDFGTFFNGDIAIRNLVYHSENEGMNCVMYSANSNVYLNNGYTKYFGCRSLTIDNLILHDAENKDFYVHFVANFDDSGELYSDRILPTIKINNVIGSDKIQVCRYPSYISKIINTSVVSKIVVENADLNGWPIVYVASSDSFEDRDLKVDIKLSSCKNVNLDARGYEFNIDVFNSTIVKTGYSRGTFHTFSCRYIFDASVNPVQDKKDKRVMYALGSIFDCTDDSTRENLQGFFGYEDGEFFKDKQDYYSAGCIFTDRLKSKFEQLD